jgi:putative toxin-antitoxin system antitoxin component (TIGR02293 family)
MGNMKTSSTAKVKVLKPGIGVKSGYVSLKREIQLFIEDAIPEYLNSGSKSSMEYSEFLSNKLLMVQAIRKGIPFSMFKSIQLVTPFSIKDWAEYLDISGKSLMRYSQQGKRFKPIHSEKIIELAEVSNLGLEVFQDSAKFKLWLETPNFALGNNKPFDLLKNSYGKAMVVGELTRINYGIFV